MQVRVLPRSAFAPGQLCGSVCACLHVCATGTVGGTRAPGRRAPSRAAAMRAHTPPPPCVAWRAHRRACVARAGTHIRVSSAVWIYTSRSYSACMHRPRGPMDKASAHGAGDCRFESCRGQLSSLDNCVVVCARMPARAHNRRCGWCAHARPPGSLTRSSHAGAPPPRAAWRAHRRACVARAGTRTRASSAV